MVGICGVKLHEAFAGSPLHVSDKAPLYPAIASIVTEPNAADPSTNGPAAAIAICARNPTIEATIIRRITSLPEVVEQPSDRTRLR